MAGKLDLWPESQIEMVDALWREYFPGKGAVCPFFDHFKPVDARAIDICKVSDVPEQLTCERLIVAGKNFDVDGLLCPVRMQAVEEWNQVEYQKTAFDGKVKAALTEWRNATGHRQIKITDDWLVVTIDYHN